MNGEIIEQGDFATHYWVADKKLLRQTWTNEQGLMSNEEFKQVMLHYLALYDEHDIKFVLVDSRQINFPVGEELQEWVNQNIMATVSSRVNKLAFLVPEDLFSQISIEQTIEGYEKDNAQNEQAIIPRYFDKENEAFDWLSKG